MLDLKFVVDNADAVKKNAERKRHVCDIDGILKLAEQRKALIHEQETSQAEFNKLNKALGPALGLLKGKTAKDLDAAGKTKLEKALKDAINPSEKAELYKKLEKATHEGADAVQAFLGGWRDRIKDAETKRDAVDKQINDLLARVPNMIHSTTPIGGGVEDNKVVRTVGDEKKFTFTPKNHFDLGTSLGLKMDIGVKLTGSGFYALSGDLARLEFALIAFFLDRAAQNGYTAWMLPFLVNTETMYGTGQLPKMQDQLYQLDARDQFYLIPTAEASLTSIHTGDKLDAKDFPIKYTGYSACFRREAGAAGAGTKGMLRVHQFNKVELFKMALPETSYDEHEKLTADAEGVLKALGLRYRTLLLCSGDMSFAAAKCYDLEVWAPATKEWWECSSCSNFEDFQARRANLKYRDDKQKLNLCHTINGSGLATPRTLMAILETYQNADGSVTIPEVLRPYMGGQKEIKPRPA